MYATVTLRPNVELYLPQRQLQDQFLEGDRKASVFLFAAEERIAAVYTDVKCTFHHIHAVTGM